MSASLVRQVLLLPPTAADSEFPMILREILLDIASGAAILHCDAGAIYVAMNKWPDGMQQKKKHIQSYMKMLKSRKRLRPIADVAAHGGALSCGHRLPGELFWDGVVGPEICSCNGRCADYRNWVSLGEYFDAQWREDVRGSGALLLRVGEWTVEQLTQSIVRPLFAATRTLDIIDFVCGKAWGGGTAQSFKRTLEWIAESLREFSPEPQPTLRIITDVPPRGLPQVQVRREMETVIKRQGCRPIVELRPQKECQFPHDRWMHTDQGWWGLGRGIDWLRADGTVQDININYYADLSLARKLDDIFREYITD